MIKKKSKMKCSRCKNLLFSNLFILCSKCFYWNKIFKSSQQTNIDDEKCVKCKSTRKNVYPVCENCLKLEENRIELPKCHVTGEYCHSDHKNASYNRCKACKEHVFLPYPDFETVLYNLYFCECQHFAMKDNIEQCPSCFKIVCNNCYKICNYCNITGCMKCIDFSLIDNKCANCCAIVHSRTI